jgi:fructosamine-3-kinase
LALEFVPSDQRHEPLFGRRFGAALARMHIASPSPNGRYGLEHDNFLGRQTQTNAWGSSWPEFYRDRRITPQLSQARPILGSIAGRVDALICRVNELLAGMPHTPCLIHGDLWSGNFLASAGEPVLVDPAVYYGHPEIEWAFIDLFGGFPSGMRVGYDEVAPLDRNYEHRRPLLQLYHLLVHVNHFGGPYVHAVDRVCAFYGE